MTGWGVVVVASVTALAATLVVVGAADNTERPVIGVLAVPDDQAVCETSLASLGTHGGNLSAVFASARIADAEGASCFGAVYTKWLEQSGLRVVPIRYDTPTDELDDLLDSLNGVLFTGGGLSLLPNTTYYHTAMHIYKRAIAYNDQGEVFPLHGTCMGFQLLNILTAEDWSVLSRYAFDSEDLSLPLDLAAGAKSSRLLSQAPANVLAALTTENITSNLHHDGVEPEKFAASDKLTSFYNIISTNKDRKGKAFVSTIEAKKYPFTGTQWHPERPQYEFKPLLNVAHSLDAIVSMQYVSMFFATEARKSTHRFKSDEDLAKALIYNYAPTTDTQGYGFLVYKFPPTTPTE